MNLEVTGCESGGDLSLNGKIADPLVDRRWYAVFTVPQNEKSVVKQLDLREVESFLPTYETVKVWKNRQKVRLILPLFPTYLFVRINRHERVKVLQSPGVLQIVGGKQDTISISDAEVEFLRAGFRGKKVEPYTDLVIGEKMRIKGGPMQGVEGILVRKNNSLRFVLSISLINQHAAVEVSADYLEPVKN
jgi:transcription antitermination factor NusG